MRVGFIGLGIMGSRMAAQLLSKGHALTVWNRTPARVQLEVDELRASGATLAKTPRALAAEVDAICICVADPVAIQAVADGPDGFLAGLSSGTLVIDFSTIGPEAARGLEAACLAHGARFLESPVTGSKNAAGAGTLLLMCGGTAETFAAAAPILSAVGAKAIHIGDVGQAAQVKLMGNVIIAHMVEALSEAAALANHAGITMEKLLEVIQSSGFASPFWDFKGKALGGGDFTTHFSVDLMHKDLTLALRLAEASGVPMPGAATIREVYQMARARGLGQKDIIATAVITNPGVLHRV